ncbi:hypothetical protein T440DRAFT_536356 [Plenodomus tracheiphilus IPT5]|uniref:MFS general substrate transporter n=1 Tax=Plenodomus tracheiphilus IPT5 TaxID=1408161 RepID=A0A6A7B2A1_9PLEO|nr:hypothetical protein T440DRAFT_536356 [Plenodomus tracheiphilus IPT5]
MFTAVSLRTPGGSSLSSTCTSPYAGKWSSIVPLWVSYGFPIAPSPRWSHIHTSDLGKPYFTRPNFIGTVIATCLAQISSYLGSVLPANTYSLINTALGPSYNLIWATNSINGLAASAPNALRGPVNAFWLSTSIPSAVFGPPVARALYQDTELQWRWCYILGYPSTGPVVFLIGMNWGGSTYPWKSGHVLGALFVESGTLVAFCYDAMVACASLAAIVDYANSIIWPTIVGQLFTTDITETGWLFCSVGDGLLLGEILGCIENLTLSTTAYLWDPADMGLVTGVMGAIRAGLSVIATSMYSSVLATESAKYIPRKLGPVAIATGLPESALPALFQGIALIVAATGVVVKDAYVASFRTMYLCTRPFGVLFRPYVERYPTDEVARKMHGKHGKSGDLEREGL